MADFGAVGEPEVTADVGAATPHTLPAAAEARSRRAGAVRANAPRWLRALAALAVVRAAALVAIAWYWLAHRDEAFGETWIVVWAASSVLFELCAAVTLWVTARGGVRTGVAVTLGLLGFGHLALGVFLFAGAAVFARLPNGVLAWGLFDNLVRGAMIVGVMWPLVLARADAINVRHTAREV